MRITNKGQITIPEHIREKLGITPGSDVDFFQEGNRVYLIKKKILSSKKNKFRRFRGIATIKMTTDEIMSLTRGDE